MGGFLSGRTSLTTVQTGDIANDAVTLAKMAHGTASQNIAYDGAGVPVDVALASANPGDSYFQAAVSSTQSISDSTYTKMICATEILDTEGEYDSTTNYRWTPAAGTYWVHVKASLWGPADGSRWITALYENGAGINYGYSVPGNGTDENTMHVFQVVEANGTDYYEGFVWQGSGSSKNLAGAANTSMSYIEGWRIK